MAQQATRAAGWYVDQEDRTRSRYFDGANWTTHVTPGVMSAFARPPEEFAVGWDEQIFASDGDAVTPGWYVDSRGSARSRYFNGKRWSTELSDEVVRRDAPPPAEFLPVRVSNRAAWGLAFMPLLSGAVEVMALRYDLEDPLVLGLLGLVNSAAIALAMYDSVSIRRAGGRVSYWWAWLAPAVHLVLRTIRTTGTWAIVVVWFAGIGATFFAVAAALPEPAVVTLDSASLEADVEQGLAETGTPYAVVTCPDVMNVRVGDTATCDMSAASVTAKVSVTVKNEAGEVSWRVDPTSVG